MSLTALSHGLAKTRRSTVILRRLVGVWEISLGPIGMKIKVKSRLLNEYMNETQVQAPQGWPSGSHNFSPCENTWELKGSQRENSFKEF